MPASGTGDNVTEPLIPSTADTASGTPARATEHQSQPDEPESVLPNQTGTIKILALLLVVVALLVTAAALLSKSGVVQPGGPPPKCRKSASLAVLRQEQAAHSANTLASNAGLLQLIVWGGKGKKAGLVFDDSHLLNLQDRKWRRVRQKAGLLENLGSLHQIWKSSPSRKALHTDSAHLPAARWKQLSMTDSDSSSMVMFGGDGLDAGYNTHGNGHNYFNDAWQVILDTGKARWQNLWNTGLPDSAPEPRRAAAGALFTTPNTTNKHILIHGGRLAAGHILDDLWQGSLGAGNITYQQLWPPQLKQDDLQNKKKKQRPFGPKARKGHAAVAVEDLDPSLVIFGGRNGIGYFDDVWAYRLSTASWEDWTPTTVGSPAPIGRDHFGAVYDSGHIYIYGGRGGSSYGQSKALDDVWRFTVASRSWTQLTTSGRAPLPRFLFGYDTMYPVLHQSNAHEQAPHSGNNLATEPESVVEGSGKNSSQLSASDRHSAADDEATSFMIPASGEHDDGLSSMLGDRTLAKAAAYEGT
ncbi:hypothetical protein ABBQ38_010219 [Trebouxia sp. C0009 RCD-2024]